MHMLWYFRHDMEAPMGSLSVATFRNCSAHTPKHTPSATLSSLQSCERVSVDAHMQALPRAHTHTHTHTYSVEF